jgi:hypothetical protein
MQAKFQVMNCAEYLELKVKYEMFSVPTNGSLDSRNLRNMVSAKK